MLWAWDLQASAIGKEWNDFFEKKSGPVSVRAARGRGGVGRPRGGPGAAGRH